MCHTTDGFIGSSSGHGFEFFEIFFFQSSQVDFRESEYDDESRNTDFQLSEELLEEDLSIAEIFKPPVICDKRDNRAEAQNENDQKENDG